MSEPLYPRELDSITGKEFEVLIVKLLVKLGFEIESQSTGPDGGIDILATSGADFVSGRYVFQCKRYSKKVGVGAVRDLRHAPQGSIPPPSPSTRGSARPQ